MIRKVLLACIAGSLAWAPAARADEAPSCAVPRFSDVGWTDISATTAVATTLLKALGYKPKASTLSVAITYNGLAQKEVDIFLGNWMPLQTQIQEPLVRSKALEVVAVNLDDAKIGLAVPRYTYEAGLKSYADIAKHASEIDGHIYGIEAGSSANKTILDMIAQDKFGLKNVSLVESSEQAMLSALATRIRQKKSIVFFGWQPHSMQLNFPIRFLDNSENVFGPEEGRSRVLTVTRAGFSKDCPNVGRFLSNLIFDVNAENVWMDDILNKGIDPDTAALSWLKKNPAVIERWLTGVMSTDGQPGFPRVKARLGF